jgi:iron complex transport system permease protein
MSPASSVERVRLILAGAAISASLGAVTGIITMVDSQAFDSYRFWVVGALNGQTVDSLWQVIPFAASGGLIGLALSGQLNAVALGDDVARALGVRLGLLKAAGFASIALLCGAATAAAGPIGFVGLVIPHALRLLLGPDWRWVLPYSLLAGPILVLASEIVGRVIAPPGEIEVGIVTAFIGAPVLLKLVTSARKERP